MITPYKPLTIDPSARVFHYGQAIFEGMKAYKDAENNIWMFRPKDNFERFNKSSVRLAIPEIPEEVFMNGIATLLRLDADWIPSGKGKSIYIRPFVFASQSGVQASAANEYTFMTICAPADAYYGGELRVKIADHFSRAASGGVGYAKAAGNYAASFYPTSLAIEEGYQQIIWTDANEHAYLEEAGTMNLFFRIGDSLITAPTSDRILDGVTRKSVIALAKSLELDVQVRPIRVEELIDAAKNNTLKEIFGSGTAVVVSAIQGFGYKNERFELPKLEDSWASKIKKALTDIQTNLADDPFGWRYKV